MMKEERYSPYSNCCGRPMHYAPANKCNYNSCCLNEYPYPMPACIRKKPYDCMAKAVIPAVTVDTVEGITNLANCFVHVTTINTTFYIDDKHRPMIVWAGSVELPDGYDLEANEYGLAGQEAYIYCDGAFCQIYFDKHGVAHQVGVEE